MKKYTRLIALLLVLLTLVMTTACRAKAPDPAETGNPTGSGSTNTSNGGSMNPSGDPTGDPTTDPTTEPTTPPPTWPTYPEDRELTAQQAFVYDCSTDEFLYITGTEEETVYLASITKLFTAHVALQYLDPETEVTVGDELDFLALGSSVATLDYGDVLTVEMLIQAMMMPSGNDAAYTLAVAAGRAIDGNPSLSASAAVNVFMSQMNQEANTRGMTNTHFINPDGIHDYDHYSSMGDLAILGKLALESPAIIRCCTVPRDIVTPIQGNSFPWKNTNELIDPASQYYCPVCIGLKTGQTPDAGSCLLSAFDLDGRQIIIGVFGCPETEDRFPDTLQLLQMCLPE